MIVSHSDALSIVPDLPYIYDEPFADSSQIPTTLVSSLVSKSVKVCLTGDAGDELFGGYNRHFLAPEVWDILSRLPALLKSSLSTLIFSLPADKLHLFFRLAHKLNLFNNFVNDLPKSCISWHPF